MTQLLATNSVEPMMTENNEYVCFHCLEEGVRRPLTDYEPVLSLTVLREGSDEREILMGVRTAVTNTTHQNVWSVPTKRIEQLEDASEWGTILCQSDGFPLSSEHIGQCNLSLRLWTNYLMMLKLGAANILESGLLDYTILKLGAWQGVSLIDYLDGHDVVERLTMYNLAVMVNSGHMEFPSRTLSYNPLVWVPISRFLRAVETRNVDDLGVPVEPLMAVEMCIRGLCVETTTLMLQEGL